MVENILGGFLSGSGRRTINTIMVFLIILMIVWPAADYYHGTTVRYERVAATLNNTKATIARLDDFGDRLKVKSAALDGLTRQSMSNEAVQALRGEIVRKVREADCTMRRLQIGEANKRPWHEDEDPTNRGQSNKSTQATPFELLTRECTLSVTGSMANVTELLEQLDTSKKLIHTLSFSMQTSGEGQNTVILEIVLLLVDLADAPAVSA